MVLWGEWRSVVRATRIERLIFGLLVVALVATAPAIAWADLRLEPEELVEASGIDIDVPGYSVPSFCDWNNDELCDLIVGEGGSVAKVRVYLNVGTHDAPQFDDYFFAQSLGEDLVEAGGG